MENPLDGVIATSLETQVARLQRQLTLTSVLALVLAGAFFFEAYLHPPTIIEAAGFIVVDESGEPRAGLTLSDGFPRLELIGADGNVAASIRAGTTGGSYLAFDAEGRNRAGVVVTAEGPIIGVRNADGVVTDSLPGRDLIGEGR